MKPMSPTDPVLIERLEKAMPATVGEFYLLIYHRWPKFWNNLNQHASPRAAVMVALQTTAVPFVDGVAPTSEELVVYFESLNLKAR